MGTRRGDACTVEVWSTDHPVLSCRIRVRCGGDTLYGLPGAGYNRCATEGAESIYATDRYGEPA